MGARADFAALGAAAWVAPQARVPALDVVRPSRPVPAAVAAGPFLSISDARSRHVVCSTKALTCGGNRGGTGPGFRSDPPASGNRPHGLEGRSGGQNAASPSRPGGTGDT